MPGLAVYPGSFDPPTLGHLDVVERAARLFDRVIVAVGVHSGKNPLLRSEDRVRALAACVSHLANVEVARFDGLLVGFARQAGANAVVRGLRATADFEYEFQMAMVNRRLDEDLETVFLMTRWEYSYLSSSIVREVALLGGEYSEMVPEGARPFIERALEGKR